MNSVLLSQAILENLLEIKRLKAEIKSLNETKKQIEEEMQERLASYELDGDKMIKKSLREESENILFG